MADGENWSTLPPMKQNLWMSSNLQLSYIYSFLSIKYHLQTFNCSLLPKFLFPSFFFWRITSRNVKTMRSRQLYSVVQEDVDAARRFCVNYKHNYKLIVSPHSFTSSWNILGLFANLLMLLYSDFMSLMFWVFFDNQAFL